MNITADEFDAIRQQVLAGEKYARLDPALVERIIREELSKNRSGRELVKAVRSKLHQTAAVYRLGQLDAENLLLRLDALPSDLYQAQTTAFCLDAMKLHQSTLERLEFIDAFFQTTLQSIQPVRSILDLACGLNPLALPWMPSAPDLVYHACDIFTDQMAFIERFFQHFRISGQTYLTDLTDSIPQVSAEVTFLLKTIPCLEQLSRNIGQRLIDSIPSAHILVSYPARSLGGRNIGMVKHYEHQFLQLIDPQRWEIERFLFPNELVFFIHRKRESVEWQRN